MMNETDQKILLKVIRKLEQLPVANKYDDAFHWAAENFEPNDLQRLKNVCDQEIHTHPGRKENPAYGDLLALIFRLSATYQFPKVGLLQGRGSKHRFRTGLDAFHPWHLVETAGYLADINLQAVGLKGQLVQIIEDYQGHPISPQQHQVLNTLCLHVQKRLVSLQLPHEPQSEDDNPSEYERPSDIEILQSILDEPDQKGFGLLTGRQMLQLPYYNPDLNLCRRLESGSVTLEDIGTNLGQSMAQEKKNALVTTFLPEVDLTTIPELGL